MNRTRLLVIVTIAVLLATLLLVQWRQAQFEREAQALEAERERLAAEVAELKQRRDLLQEARRLSAAKEFYVVLWLDARQVELRLEDRALRRVLLADASRLPSPGRHELQRAEATRLDWGGVVVAPEATGCIGWPRCLAVAAEDYAALSRLKPGTVLVVLP
jgi:hypothetical protein